MSRIPNLLLLGLLVALFAAGQAQRHTNIDYLSFGYDIYRGNPHSNQGIDPGFKFGRVFDLTYNNSTKSSDGAWDVPDAVTMARTDSCTLNFDSRKLTSMASYQESLEFEVTVTGGVIGIASFKASTAYKSMEKSMTTTDDKYMYSAAVCDVYKAKMNPYNPPKLHSEFIYALKSLPTNYDEQAYFKFLDNYGTHAVLEINMGARYGMISSISERADNQFRSEGIKTTFAASGMIKGICGGADTLSIVEKEWAKQYASNTTNYQIISVGAKPVANGDALAWAQQAMAQPMPLRYTLTPISEILTPLYVRDALDSSRMDSIRANLQKALGNFCKNHLKVEGLLVDCNRAPDGKQKKINSCKWCADRCGGEFPVDGGHFSDGRNWPNWHYSLAPGCTGSFGNHKLNTGTHLCCPNVDSNQKGQCRVCSSCGGGFDYNAGSGLVDVNWDKFVSAYDTKCQGSLRTRNNPGNGFNICCQSEPICSLCSSCGGSWPHESGVLAADKNWPKFFMGRGHKCSGVLITGDAKFAPRNDAKGGMKWCCKSK